LQKVATLLDAASQQNEPGFKVVFDVGQLQTRIQPNLLVRELASTIGQIGVDNLPKDASRHAFHQIGIVNEDTVVRFVVFDREHGPAWFAIPR
jgi:hypothetical protein